MARASKEQSLVTAERILACATQHFAVLGFAAAGLDSIATDAQVTRGAIYNHFGSKRGLFEVVFADAQRGVAAAVSLAADEAPDLWQGLLAGCRAFLTASLDDAVRRIVLVDAPAVLGWNAWLEEDSANSRRLLDGALDELAAFGLIAPDELEETGVLLSGAMNAAALAIADSADREEALDRSWRALERMIGALRRT